MNVADRAREAARQVTGQFGAQEHTAPDLALHAVPDVSGWGTWNDDEECHLIAIEQVGLAPLEFSAQSRVYGILSAREDGEREFDPPVLIPVSSITTSMQPHLRRDALQWYLDTDREHEDTFDDQLSFYGADGPLGILQPDGTVTIIDGNHRFAAAKLRGDETFAIQILGEDPNPWFCTLCGRMSAPNHIGPLHGLPLWDRMTEVVHRPRTAAQAAVNAEERDPMTVAADRRSGRA